MASRTQCYPHHAFVFILQVKHKAFNDFRGGKANDQFCGTRAASGSCRSHTQRQKTWRPACVAAEQFELDLNTAKTLGRTTDLLARADEMIE